MATRACSWCGDPYTPQRWTLDWHNFCSRAHAKAAQRAGRCPGDDAVLLVRPRSLRVAHLALDKGVPFEQLVLSQDERDLLIVSHPDFAGGRLEAATRRCPSCSSTP
jgi:hypothetical protein